MKFIKSRDRNQLEFYYLEEAIVSENEVRLIDLFVSSLPLKEFGFKTDISINSRTGE
jgi:hypothetical protein